jgi:hypothetical protein
VPSKKQKLNWELVPGVITANTNEQAALENLAAVVGRSPDEIMKFLQ